jgi:hypothetical protein
MRDRIAAVVQMTRTAKPNRQAARKALSVASGDSGDADVSAAIAEIFDFDIA